MSCFGHVPGRSLLHNHPVLSWSWRQALIKGAHAQSLKACRRTIFLGPRCPEQWGVSPD
jgi:hypothetical protein